LLGWATYYLLSREPVTSKVANSVLATASMLLCLGLLESVAFVGMVDYRLLIAPPQALMVRLKPWENPANLLDPELVHVHRPLQKFVGEAPGDLVGWLDIATDKRYHVDVQYDSRGYRNDHELTRAPVVIVGDSFVEAAFVPQKQLLSSQLSERMGVEVANLGVSGYGPQQELIVLRRHGLALQPEIVLWLFFEGNDLIDLRRYDEIMQDWQATIDEYHGFWRRSFTVNALDALIAYLAPEPQIDGAEAERRSCWVAAGQAGKQRMYFAYAGAPLATQDLESLEKAKDILSRAQQESAARNAQLVLVFVPTKFRVYHDLCEFAPDSYGQQWVLNDLPARLETWSGEQGLPFLDLTPALQEAAAQELVYFTDDGHWNDKANDVAAQMLDSFIRDHALRKVALD
jgi:hypothetical protein